MGTKSWIRVYVDYMHSLDEYWRRLDYDYINRELYEVSTKGRLRHYYSKTIIEPFNNLGYEIVSLYDYENNLRNIGIHRLVAHTFCPGRTNDCDQVNHINGIKNDNNFTNLEWCTVCENNRHGHEHNLMRNPLSKYEKLERKDDINKIKNSLINNNGKASETFDELKNEITWLTYPIVLDIKSANTYKDMTGFTKDTFSDTILNDDTVHEICKTLIETNGSIKETVRILSPKNPLITNPVVDNIKRCHTHRDISRMYFNKDYFDWKFELSDDQVILIAKTAKKYSGYGAAMKVLRELLPVIPKLTKKQVRDIMNRITHKELLRLFDDRIITG